jgi:hypothetical protein
MQLKPRPPPMQDGPWPASLTTPWPGMSEYRAAAPTPPLGRLEQGAELGAGGGAEPGGASGDAQPAAVVEPAEDARAVVLGASRGGRLG